MSHLYRIIGCLVGVRFYYGMDADVGLDQTGIQIEMSLSYVWLLATLVTSWSGWLIAGRTEVATLLLGITMVLLSGLELVATKTGNVPKIMPACGLAAGAGVLCAGVFDRLDINRIASSADWVTGFVVGALIVGVPYFKLNRGDRRTHSGFSVGDIPFPHWDAIWISLAYGFWLLVNDGVNLWFSLHGTDVPEWVSALGCSLAWALVVAIVQALRFGSIHRMRLLLAAISPLFIFLADHTGSDALSITVGLISFWAICCAGGGYPLRWPSGTFTDGWVQLRSWVLTGLLAFLMTINIAGSLTNRTVTDIVESYGRFAPVSGEAFRRLVMDDAYLWHREISSSGVDIGDSHPLLKGMHVAENDRFSAAWTGDFEVGQPSAKGNPGVFLSRQGGQTFVAHVIPGSPADRAGVARGWRPLPTGRGNNDRNTKEAVYAFVAPGDARREVSEVLEGKPLVDFRVESSSGRRIGYLYLDRFDPGAKSQLDKAFAEFSKVKIEELVIDLRYNPGGAVLVVDHLASLIAGNKHAGEILYRVTNNTKYTDADDVGRFRFSPNGVDVARVFVLTSEHSCSASELLVVGLQAYLPIVTIGEVTCGKPLGSRLVHFGNQFFRVISFRVSDARGQGFYNEGLVPHCFKGDDLKQSFKLGTRNDPVFRIAQNYMVSGQCE